MTQIIRTLGNFLAYIPSYGGFSADPSSVTARYVVIGKLCTVYVRAIAGTSNATTFTITLPIAAANTAIQGFAVIVTDNSINAIGRFATRVNSTTVDIYPSATATAWTNSGSKNCSFCITYETI